MRRSRTSILLSFVISITSFTKNNNNNNGNGNVNNSHLLAAAANVRRGSVKPKDEIPDMSTTTTTTTRSLASLPTSLALTQAETIFNMKKTPPVFKSSKCGGDSMLRKQHPLCFRTKEEEEDDETPSKPPSIPLFAPPTGAPTLSPLSSPAPTITTTTSPAPTTTSAPTRLQDRPLNCIQTVQGGGEAQLSIPPNRRYRQGEVHCLKLMDQEEEEEEQVYYFGITWTNQFGLFHSSNNNDDEDDEPIWTIPPDATMDGDNLDRWAFQNDGNLVLRNTGNQAIWNSESHGNRESLLLISQDRVWIETDEDSGVEVWATAPAPTNAPTLSVRPTMSPSTSAPTTPLPSMTPSTHFPSQSPSTPFPSQSPSTSFPSQSPTRLQDRPLNCVQTVEGIELEIPQNTRYRQGDVHCLKLPRVVEDEEEEQEEQPQQYVYFGYTWTNQFGLFLQQPANNTTTTTTTAVSDKGDGILLLTPVWTLPDAIVDDLDRWTFQNDGNLVLRNTQTNIWNSQSHSGSTSRLLMSQDRVWIETNSGRELWSQPAFVIPPTPPFEGEYPDPNGALQYYAYYYPWYHRGDWSRHGYQDEPLLGKYGTDEVAVAEQHIEWALQTGITSWIVSWWGPNSLSMKHFKNGMMNAPSLSKIKFCMLYETPILDDRGNWYDGSLEDALYDDLKVIRDEFLDHPSYLHINGRPVIIFYITRSRMDFQEGFDGPSVLANMRRRLDVDIYFIADEPFFNWFNKRPEGNDNAFSKNGTQVFDAYTTYNMYTDSRVRDGETVTSYQLREAMPVWQEWSKELPFFPNVMPQYYDFRGHKPLLGNSADFKMQLREVACLPRTNFNGAPHIMMITSFNEWWEGTQIEPDNGSPDNWSNYGFQFMETLAEFKREVDSVGAYWCDEVQAEGTNEG